MMALDMRRQRQIFQTVTCRMDRREEGPPASYSDEEKAYYLEVEKEIIENRKAGRIVNYDFPYDYD